MPTREEIAAYYRQLSDARLVDLARREARDLTEEALAILTDEARTRGLLETLEDEIEMQRRELTVEEEAELVHWVQHSPCPRCGRSDRRVNAATIAMAFSCLVGVYYRERVVVGCTVCLLARSRWSSFVSALFGWWSPVGPVRTVCALMHNTRGVGFGPRPSPELEEHVRKNYICYRLSRASRAQ